MALNTAFLTNHFTCLL